jgi:ribosome production factor 1
VVPDDDEVAADEACDEFSPYFTKGVAPRMLITTSKGCAKKASVFAAELSDVFPNSEYVRRGRKRSIRDIVEFCRKHGYTDLLVVNEDHKTPSMSAVRR